LNQPADCAVLIAAIDLLPVLEERARTLGAETELIGFADTDALRALEVIRERRPGLVALEKDFAATHRGAALIDRLRADPALTRLEIRVVSAGAKAAPDVASAAAEPPVVDVPVSSLDYRGTRRAPRYQMAEALMADVNGNAATVVDLSTIGAQVVSATILKPNQRVRVTFSDERGQVRCQAVVAWASFEMPPDSGPRYRAGLQFLNPNTEVLDAFRVRHQRP
jgi:hypothetical protein